MCVKRTSLQSIVRLWPDNDTRDMLSHRCPECGCTEEAGVPLRFQMRLQRTVRVISVCLVLLLGMALATLALLLFGSSAPLRQREQPAMLSTPRSEKQQSGNDLSRPSAQLSINPENKTEWQHKYGNTHVQGGMRYNDNTSYLIVPSEGLYRLYLQITFQFKHDKNAKSDLCGDGPMKLNISVARRSSSYDDFMILLESIDTMSCSQSWIKSLFVSGTFDLDAETELRVEIKHLQLVYPQDTLSFFGAEFISPLTSLR